MVLMALGTLMLLVTFSLSEEEELKLCDVPLTHQIDVLYSKQIWSQILIFCLLAPSVAAIATMNCQEALYLFV